MRLRKPRLRMTMALLTVLTAVAAPVLVTTVAPPALATEGPTIQATERSMRCARAAQAAGWSGGPLVTAVAISLAESWCTANAVHSNPANADCPYGSLDRGAWQINNCYQSWVSDSCAYELYCNARAAHTIYGWSGWTPWTTYVNGDYLDYWAEAQAGVNAIGGAIYGTVNTGGGSLYIRSGPSTSYQVVGSVANGATVRIYCQTRGQWVYSEVYQVWTDLWDRIGTGQYVTDAYVYTGSNGQVAPTC